MSTKTDRTSGSWGPAGKPGAVSFTFDNMGEAAELELGLWPQGHAIGNHYSARQVIPALLDRIRGFRATFFVEGWNAEIYPDTLRSIAAAEHDLGLHGWRHETWAKQDAATQRSIVERGVKAFRELGISPRGFRPPGGVSTPLLTQLVRSHGLSFVSDLGDETEVTDDVARLPFAWLGVDGVFLEPSLGASLGVCGADDASLEGLIRHHKSQMLVAKERGEHVVFVFHPFLLGKNPLHMAALFELIEFARRQGNLWIAPLSEVADWVRHQSDGPGE